MRSHHFTAAVLVFVVAVGGVDVLVVISTEGALRLPMTFDDHPSLPTRPTHISVSYTHLTLPTTPYV